MLPLRADTSSRWFRDRLARLPLEAGRGEARVAVLETPALPGGAMPPLHAAARDESYHLLNGSATFYVGDEVVNAVAGEAVVAPAGEPRTFLVTSETATWLILTSVRSLGRYKDFLRAVSLGWNVDGARRGAWAREEDASALSAIAAANDIDVLGPPGMRPCDLGTVSCP